MPSRDETRKRRVALVLQGGGALGAYQAGVYEALHRHHVVPDWVVGTSIGAINAALIAGNPPEARVARLREFWHCVACDDALDLHSAPDALRRYSTWLTTLGTVAQGVPGFFAPRLPGAFATGLAVPPQAASFYDTEPLAGTLARLVDFGHLASADAMRLTVAAVQVTTGKLVAFDSARQRLSVEHVMASGALPPGFPPVRIEDELYWDGGLYSNTPLELVLEDEPRSDTLCFMVELWRGSGPEPRSLGEVQTRQKDIVFASRSTRHIEAYRRMHGLRHAVRTLYAALPAEQRASPELRDLGSVGCGTSMHIVRLIYPGHDWKMASKDVNFSRGSIQWRWQQGLRDAERVLAQAPWEAPVSPEAGVLVHELAEEPD
ncbi:MAG: patatin-like phospholipase family protein [Sphingomonadaceae bacterium]